MLKPESKTFVGIFKIWSSVQTFVSALFSIVTGSFPKLIHNQKKFLSALAVDLL